MNDVGNERELISRLDEVLRLGMFTVSVDYILRCAEVGVIVEIDNDEFFYRLENGDLSYGAGCLGERYTLEEITWVADGIAELRTLDVDGAATLPIDELAVRVSHLIDQEPAMWAVPQVA